MVNFTINNGVLEKYSGNEPVITIPEGVTGIGRWHWDAVFQNHKELKIVNLPKGLLNIEWASFKGCSGLTSIVIPEDVQTIGREAFEGCSSLANICIPDSVTCIEDEVFSGCSGLTSINIPEGVTIIGCDAFSGCSKLTSINIPNSVRKIGYRAFDGCTGLTSINIPDGVEEIGFCAFRNCIGLTSINIPEGIKEIGWFEGCTGLTNINIPNGVKEIKCTAFKGCTGLTSVNIPEGVTKIGYSAFENCSKLTNIIIPNEVIEIEQEAFKNCSGLTSVNIPKELKSIAFRVFRGCSGLTSVNIPVGVTSIGASAFSSCSSLKFVDIPEGITEIGDSAFYYCSSLTSVNIPEGVKVIGEFAFKGCSNLTNISIPDSVISIGRGAFSDCSSLTYLNIPAGIPGIENNIYELISGCTNLAGVNDRFFIFNHYLIKYNGDDADVEVPNETEAICNNVFANHKEIISVILPTGIRSIGSKAFSGCSGLTSVNIPVSVASIGDGAFSGCSGLTNISIPDNVTSIGREAFSGCSNLTSIIIPDNVSRIQNETFLNCSGLKNITIPDSVTRIGYKAFSGCIGLTNIIIPDAYQIGDGAFIGCKNLKEIKILGEVEEIDISVFSGCEKLENVVFGTKTCKILWDPDYGEYSVDDIHLNSQMIKSVYPFMSDLVLREFVLTREIWEKLSPEVQTDIFLNRRSKSVKDLYSFAQPEIIGEIIVKRLSGKPTSKNCEAAASFAILFYTLIPKELTEKIYSGLKATKTGAKAVSMFESDQALMTFINEESEETKHLPVEKKVMEILMAQNISLKAPEFNLNQYYSINSEELPIIKDKEENTVSSFVLSWLLTVHEGWQPYGKGGGNCYEIWDKPGICPESRDVVALIDPNSFQQALDKIAYYFGSMGKVLDLAYPVCRYADEKTMENLTKRASKYWVSSTSGINAPGMRSFRKAAKYSATRAAMFFAEKYGDLDDYAQLRGVDTDSVRDRIIADTGLDTDRSKTYDLGNQTVKIRLLKDLSFTVELPDGKTAKSLPKKNADPEKYAAANEDFSGLKKSIKKIIKNRISSLFEDLLSGRARNAESWKGSYLGNPLLRDIASLLVWQQGQNNFTLTETGVIDSAGNPYSLTDEDIYLAYPSEMDAQDLVAWQDYFMANHLKQPFLQLWEPVRDLSEVKPYRYIGYQIPYYRFLHQEKHGISIDSNYYGDSIEYTFTGWKVELKRISGWEHINADDLFEITEIKPDESGNGRYANHIIVYLDRITVWERIRTDDTAIIDLLPQFTAAQISEFISIATEENAVNVTAMLLEYKNTNYPNLDPLAEFTLDFL